MKADYLNLLCDRVSVRQFINYDLPINRRTRSAFRCEFCLNPANRLLVNDEKRKFVCMDCGKTGDVFHYVMLTQKVDFDRAVDLVSEVSATLYQSRIPVNVSEMERVGRWQTSIN